ncbi:alpha/beta hydrolase [Streptomyces albiaxialis]|uniref:Alpha/beta hydrolase n=1 Tax=Streptomyces albiaxialis TaxID=329523 RepID=A0ABN2WKY1_9ACTN
MPLDPQVEALRAARTAAAAPPLYTMSLDEARAADRADALASGGDPEPVGEVTDTAMPGPGGPLPLRIFRPDVPDVPEAPDDPDAPGPLPVLAYFFGGGWTLGSLDTCDAICRRLANAVPCVAVAVGYRLAPEHKFPAAVEDCFAAVRWAAAHASGYGGDPGRLAVGGDSAGGNLAAVTSLLARERSGPPLAAQLLVYPNTDHHADTPSQRENTDDAFFNARSVDWYWRHYLRGPEDGASPYVSPLRARDLGGLPPALVITAEYDPLRDEGEAYARRLREAGTPAALSRYDGMIHGFFAMPGVLDAAGAALDEAAEFLRVRLAPGAGGAR